MEPSVLANIKNKILILEKMWSPYVIYTTLCL